MSTIHGTKSTVLTSVAHTENDGPIIGLISTDYNDGNTEDIKQ